METSSGRKYLGGVPDTVREGGSAPGSTPLMCARPRKRSLTLQGHRTSVSLEDEFWNAFRDITARQKRPLNDLAAEIDAARGTECGLASAIRLYVLRHFRDS